ncbi:MAG: DMT family transporter [Marinibacterium sp.]|nr:DMT family transporter [Marinibacterium sp.]
MTAHRPGLAVLLKVSAIALFTTMAALVKVVSADVPAGEAVFFRSLFAIPPIFVWLALRGDLAKGVRVKDPWGHVRRGVLGTTGMGLTFAGLGYLPLPEVTAIGFATPIFTVILAAVFLGEKIRLVRISAVVVGLIGVTIMLWPRLGTGPAAAEADRMAMIGALLILGATMARACVQIQIRQLVQTDSTAAIVFWFSMTATVLSALSFPFGWVMPPPGLLALLVLAGLVGGVAQILVTSSYRYAPASMLAPYDYSSMLFALVIGFVWFAELPTALMLVGALLVIAANVLVVWREGQLGLDRGRARSVTDPKG